MLLRINLDERDFKMEKIQEIDKWIGGRGLAINYFKKNVDPNVSALDSPIIFSAGPLNEYMLPNKGCSATISPKNNRFHVSFAGDFGMYLKLLGFYLLIIEEKSEKPVYIVIEEDKVAFHGAEKLWGKGIYETVSTLKKQYKDYVILAIGPAGEKLNPIASISIDGKSFFGRGGHGAVLGYKKVKAILIKKELPKINRNIIKFVKKLRDSKLVQDLSMGGTLYMLASRLLGMIPLNNFKDTLKSYDFSKWLQNIKHNPCSYCPIACKKKYKSKEGPEYWGGFVSLGSLLGITDIDVISDLYYKVNDLGLDAISTGHIIAKNLESFGNINKINELINKILEAKIELKGNYLIKDMENSLVKYDGQEFKLALETNNKADVRQYFLKAVLNKEKVKNIEEYVYHIQNLEAIADSSVLCAFTIYSLNYEDFSKLLTIATNIKYSKKDLEKIANRIIVAEWEFNKERGYDDKILEIRLQDI